MKEPDDGLVLPEMSVEELDTACAKLIAELQAGIDAYEERVALQAVDDGLTTDQRAIAALDRPERFAGEHEVARAWLKNYAKNVGIFRRGVR